MKKTIRTLIIFSILLLLVPNVFAFNPFYKVLGLFVKFSPEITAANVYPVKIRPGDVLLINVTARDVYGIDKVTAKVYHESGFDLVELSLKKGNNYQGAWVGHNMKNMEWYDVDIEVTNIYGVSSFTKLKYQDPTKSHPASEVTAGTFDAGDFTFQNNLTVDSGTLHVDSTGDKVGIGTTTPNENLTVVGNVNVTGNITGSKAMSIAKAWVNFDGTDCSSSLCTIRGSYNVINVTQTIDPGYFSVFWNTSFANANYAVSLVMNYPGAEAVIQINGMATDNMGVHITQPGVGNYDASIINVVAFGIQ